MSFFNKNDVIEMAINMEKNGYSFYNKALQRPNIDSELESVLTGLRNDENEHRQTFLALRDKIDKLRIEDSPTWKDAKDYIETVVESHVFNDSDKAIQLAQNASDVSQLLDYAVQFEKDTILFFFAISKHIKGEKAEKAIQSIIEEEYSHIKKIRDLKKKIKK